LVPAKRVRSWTKAGERARARTAVLLGRPLFAEAALPVAVRIEPVETLPGKLRFFEWDGFAPGSVRLALVLEGAGAQIHRHTVSEFFDIPQNK